MKRAELFTELQNWLRAAEFAFDSDQDNAALAFAVNGKRGQWSCRVICEDDPPALQVICRFPIAVPADKVVAVGLLLHNFNFRVSLGAFTLATEERGIGFRLPFPIRPEAPLSEQFEHAIGTACRTCDDAFQALALFVCDTPEANKLLNELRPNAELLSSRASSPTGGRLELN